MIMKKELKKWLRKIVFGCFLIMMTLGGVISNTLINQSAVYAVPESQETAAETTDETAKETGQEEQSDNSGSTCQDSMGAVGWLVCPTTGKISEAVDVLYDMIEGALVVNPVSSEDGSPIYEVWKYCRGITNIVFIIFFLVVIYSQLTGLGISNYGVKKALPKLIIAAVLVNLSFVICSLAVDVSNIVGNGLRGVFNTIGESVATAYPNMAGESMHVGMAETFVAIAGGSALAIGGLAIAVESGAIFMLIPIVLGAIVSMVIGFITIALRQAVVALLLMISPLAIVAIILPNTESLFKKWKALLMRMLVFYPMFSLLFGASSLAGFAIVASAQDAFGVLLGIAVQIFPLFFSWSLMRMSGTFLGDINSGLRNLAGRPLAANRRWAESRRDSTRAFFALNSPTPYGHLRRYMDERKAKREWAAETRAGIRQNEINAKLQKTIASGYDGTKADDTKGEFKPNKYSKLAKDYTNSKLASETATADTAHAISNYGDYYVGAKTRKMVEEAKKNKDKDALKELERTDSEYRRAVVGANNFVEYGRAQMTKENDDEADMNFLVGKYLDAVKNYDPNTEDEAFDEYRHLILSSAGGLGKVGQTRVLGKIIAKAAAVESNQRRDINIIANKFPHMKNDFRNMVVGYAHDSDGYAINQNGERIENVRGWLLANDPDKLVTWDKVDENGDPYFDWIDPASGQYVTRIYKKDKAAVKELLTNFDIPINDPVNNLYGILSGIKEGSVVGNNVNLKNIGLDGYRTTISRALTVFKEKNAAYSPMVKEMVARGYIQNYTQECLAYLDSIIKTTKPGAWNVQDRDAVETFAAIVDPKNWEEIFPTDLIRTYRNVDGDYIKGLRYNEDGSKTDVPAEEATREELMNRVIEKFIKPAIKKMPALTRKTTPNVADNQKPEVAKSWGALFEAVERCGEEIGVDPYAQDKGTNYLKEVRDKFNHSMGVNHHAEVFELNNRALTPDEFAVLFTRYCQRYPELEWIANQFEDFVTSEGYNVSQKQLYDKAIELLDCLN